MPVVTRSQTRNQSNISTITPPSIIPPIILSDKIKNDLQFELQIEINMNDKTITELQTLMNLISMCKNEPVCNDQITNELQSVINKFKSVYNEQNMNNEQRQLLDNANCILATRQFIKKCKQLLYECENVSTKKDKMKVALKLFQLLNTDLCNILETYNNSLDYYSKFIGVVIDKITTFIKDYSLGQWDTIDDVGVVRRFILELKTTHKLLKTIINKYEGLKYKELFMSYKNKLDTINI